MAGRGRWRRARPGVDPGGWEIERWDAYGHPTGLHDAPHQDPSAYQDRPWLDFQWCQTGHTGEHLPNRVATMWERRPAKAVANGEPTYEHIGRPGRAAGWWQGHEAWMDLCSGGTMGVVYGAGSLWQWRLTTSEEHPAWCMAEHASWREALDFPGSAHVGAMARILDGLDLDGMAPDFLHCVARPALLAPRRLLIVYLHDGGLMRATRRMEDVPPFWRLFDALSGALLATGEGLEDRRRAARHRLHRARRRSERLPFGLTHSPPVAKRSARWRCTRRTAGADTCH